MSFCLTLEQLDTYFQLHLSLTSSPPPSLDLFSLPRTLSVLFSSSLSVCLCLCLPSIFFHTFLFISLPSVSALISQFFSLRFHLHTQTHTQDFHIALPACRAAAAAGFLPPLLTSKNGKGWNAQDAVWNIVVPLFCVLFNDISIQQKHVQLDFCDCLPLRLQMSWDF